MQKRDFLVDDAEVERLRSENTSFIGDICHQIDFFCEVSLAVSV